MKKSFFILIILIHMTYAQNQGSTAGAFLRVGLGARALSLGGAQVAWDDADGMTFFYNPALIPFLKNITASFNYQFMPLDRSISHMGVSFPVKPTGGFSINWLHGGIRDLRSYNSYGEDTGALDYGDEAFYASFAQTFGARLYAGFSFKFLWQHIGDGSDDFSYSSTGKAFDFGIAAKLHQKLMAGLVIRNLAGTLKSNTNDIYEKGMEIEEKLPIYFVGGLKYQTPLEQITVESDFLFSNMGKRDILLGAQYSYHDVFVRLGTQDEWVHFGGGFNKQLTTGVVMGLDYAFVPGHYDEGSSHLFSWKFFID